MSYLATRSSSDYALTENISTTRRCLMRVANDLSGQVVLKHAPPIAFGDLTSIHQGHVKNGRMVVVKFLKARRSTANPTKWEDSLKTTLAREINLWSSLSHKNVAQLYGCINDMSDFSGMVMKWYKNGNAMEYLEKSPFITSNLRFRLVQDVAEGLSYLHSNGVVHGSLKPRNILINDNGIAQISDFGLFRVSELLGPSNATMTSICGEAERYRAHELYPTRDNRNPQPTFASDVYALGCVAFEFFYGKVPFHELDTIYDVFDAIKGRQLPESHPPSDSELRSIFDRRGSQIFDSDAASDLGHFTLFFWDLLESCWNLIPEDRPDASEVVENLAEIDHLYIS